MQGGSVTSIIFGLSLLYPAVFAVLSSPHCTRPSYACPVGSYSVSALTVTHLIKNRETFKSHPNLKMEKLRFLCD